jgi:hypothetical protein
LTYNSSDLTISGALVDPSLAASYGATLSLDTASTPGTAIIDFSATTPLASASGGPILLGGLTATVPSAAMYRAKDLLHFSSVSLEAGGNPVAAIGADALHMVVFPGDTTGADGYISSARCPRLAACGRQSVCGPGRRCGASPARGIGLADECGRVGPGRS